MSITTSEYEEMLEEYIEGGSLQEKIKLYLDVYVGNKSGHTLLDIAKQILFFDMGIDSFTCPYCHKGWQVLSLERRIQITTFILSKRLSEYEVDNELKNLLRGRVKNASEFISEYWRQMRLAIELQHTNKH